MKTESYLSGKFIVTVDVDIPFDDYPNTEESHKALRWLIQNKTIEKLNMGLNELREKHGVNLVYMPQHINGGPIEP